MSINKSKESSPTCISTKNACPDKSKSRFYN